MLHTQSRYYAASSSPTKQTHTHTQRTNTHADGCETFHVKHQETAEEQQARLDAFARELEAQASAATAAGGGGGAAAAASAAAPLSE